MRSKKESTNKQSPEKSVHLGLTKNFHFEQITTADVSSAQSRLKGRSPTWLVWSLLLSLVWSSSPFALEKHNEPVRQAVTGSTPLLKPCQHMRSDGALWTPHPLLLALSTLPTCFLTFVHSLQRTNDIVNTRKLIFDLHVKEIRHGF